MGRCVVFGEYAVALRVEDQKGRDGVERQIGLSEEACKRIGAPRI